MPAVEAYDEKASTKSGTDSSGSSTVDLIKAGEGVRDTHQHMVEYSLGFTSVFSTLGLMSVVLIIALDNYIIGMVLP